MKAPTGPTDSATGTTRALPRTLGLHGRTAALWAMAGGITLGGVFVAAMTLSGRISGHALFTTATGLFVVGAMLGFGHGSVLGILGRPREVTRREALHDIGIASLYAIPGIAVAWLVTIWTAMTVVAAYSGSTGATIGVAAGWTAAAALLGAAAVHGVRTLSNAYARWPERRIGTLLVAGTFAALLMTFLADRPELWGTRLRFTEPGAVLLAAAIAVWFVGPAVTIALRLAHQVPAPGMRAGMGGVRWTVADLTVGLLVGTVTGLVAVPFITPTAAPATAGALVSAVGYAMVDEVVLRLVLVTGVAWLLLRWHRIHAGEAAVAAVLTATVVQVALYTPGAVTTGHVSWIGTAGFLTAAVALPAIVFGTLFWKRGFGTALAADVAALAVITLIV